MEPTTTGPRVPDGAWDSHMHVVHLETYQLAADAAYRPAASHTLDDALALEASFGIRNMVLVQPSIYGFDNACLLDALATLGPVCGRGVVSFDPAATSQAQLREWHDLGVRGVRLNIQSHGRQVGSDELLHELRAYADAVRPLGWAVQVHVPMALVSVLEPLIPALNVRFCIDHMGQPPLKEQSFSDPYDMPGFAALARLVRTGLSFVKLSAPYRMCRSGDYSDLEPAAREILRLGGKSRVVFATDWPHTRFEGMDIAPWFTTVFEWCDKDQSLIDSVFQGNAEQLWDVRRS